MLFGTEVTAIVMNTTLKRAVQGQPFSSIGGGELQIFRR